MNTSDADKTYISSWNIETKVRKPAAGRLIMIIKKNYIQFT